MTTTASVPEQKDISQPTPTQDSKDPEDSTPTTRLKIVFFHPDLGIGGAERLVVDAAKGLQDQGHRVLIYTSHFDPSHAFDEVADGTVPVLVRGNTIFPRTIFGRFHILLATLRQIHLILAVTYLDRELYRLKPDVFFVDQLPACVPVLKWMFPGRQRTLFYCHFPDQLLAKRDEDGLIGWVKWLYRVPFDWFEGFTMFAADRIVVNSKFTREMSTKVFPRLGSGMKVIYPCVEDEVNGTADKLDKSEQVIWGGKFKIILSINRFERKKNVALAIRAYDGLTADEKQKTRLVIAGGYDQRVTENVQHQQELVELAESLGLSTATVKTVPTALAVPDSIKVLFILSVPGPFKDTLLRNAKLLVYTPTNEHFGIVPVEAMKYGVPVLATNTGGPLETIIDGETGWLRDGSKTEDWTAIIRKVVSGLSTADSKCMAEKAQARVRDHFTKKTMAKTLETEMREMLAGPRSYFLESSDVFMIVGVAFVFICGLILAIVQTRLDGLWGGDARASEFTRAQKQPANPQAETSQKDFQFYSMKIL